MNAEMDKMHIGQDVHVVPPAVIGEKQPVTPSKPALRKIKRTQVDTTREETAMRRDGNAGVNGVEDTSLQHVGGLIAFTILVVILINILSFAFR